MRALFAAAILALAGLTGAAHAQDTSVQEEDVVWATPDGLELQARIYRGPGRPAEYPMPTVIDIHGGAWSAADRTGSVSYKHALAQDGFLVIAVDFRQGPDFKHPAASADATAAVRWARLNADTLGVDPERITLSGGSSGGHLALLAALRPNAPEHLGTPITDLSDPDAPAAAHDDIDASVGKVIALWPVSDPLARFRYAQRARIEFILNGHENYFASDPEAMTDASIPAIVASGEAGSGDDLPAILVVQAGADGNVPQEINLDLLRAWQSRDGRIEYAFFPGAAHGFGSREGSDTDVMVSQMLGFLRR